ncbi:MAG: DUF4347 domain-containing protein [Pegethrix bostrychoides GSE-TBD4-15B]|jgi:glucose/arabinose dehydrogenase|uniref:DUF4347 domain-containing protein n=1 Tax=Pegethrix bostrychoides GSE-TBD4-15B TaxID=2839662 RepID=A0A951P6J1_9CYAN|nr:DUF4347 domain-containing protein [Pegethrix bostrychoides GSE-TBD4-15B]
MSQALSSSPGLSPEQIPAPVFRSAELPSLGSNSKHLVFIDTSVAELDALIAQIKSAEIILLDPQKNGIQQIADALSQRQNLESLQIISHGQAGGVQLGSVLLDQQSLETHVASLKAWGNTLSEQADVLFYGCNIAAGAAGTQFVQRLSQITGADIAASDDLTGSAALGGNWQLEVTTGQIEAESAFLPAVAQIYQAILPLYNGREYLLTGNLTWEQAEAEAQRQGGHLVTLNSAAEETWLKQTFSGTEGLWIGINDRRVEGQFEWVSGEAVTYSNWAVGEPNNYKGNEDFGMMNFGSSRHWNDESPTRKLRGIIERDPASAPIYNGNQYRLTDSLTWEQAQAEAQRQGGHLVTLNSAAEETWLKQTFSGTEGLWIGINDRRIEGQFEWGSGEAVTYSNWAAGEPNNYKGNEDFGMMNFGSSHRWNDESPTRKLRGIIEINGAPQLGSIALEQNTYSLNERAGAVEIAVSRSGHSSGAASVQYRADSGTAISGLDFAATVGTLSFAAGETRKLVRIPVINDDLDEENESFTLILQAPEAANLGTIRTATITILDDENPALTVNPVQASEASGAALVTVTRGSGIGSASVDYATQPGTALPVSDYQSATGTLSFAPGETSKTIQIALVNDAVAENHESFQIGFSNPMSVTLNSLNPVTVTILDDDPGSFVRETVITGLVQPTAFARTPLKAGFPELMFIAEKSGLVKVAQNNSVAPVPFIDLRDEVNNVRDRGLLGIAVHPDFYSGLPYLYLAYTYDPPEAALNLNPNTTLDERDQPGNRPVRVVRIKADAGSGYRQAVSSSDPDRQVVILGKNSSWANTSRPDGNSTADFSIPESGRNPDGSYLQDYIKTDSESHSVGQLGFGADGALYVSIGDGASYNSVDPRAVSVLNPDSLSGKILRVDPLTGQGFADNPFSDGNLESNRSKVWNLGLRNPFRFTFQPGTSTPFISDVGWDTWEEVNVGQRGANFGWPAYEGGNGNSLLQSQYGGLSTVQDFLSSGQPVTAAIYSRRHSEGARAIIMGDFYDGSSFVGYSGALFVADVNEGTVDALTLNSQNQVTAVQRFATGAQGIVYLETGSDGNLYFVNLGTGTIGRWRPA